MNAKKKDNLWLAHHGIKGMKWGVRNYQNEDGTLTEAGKARYNVKSDHDYKKLAKYAQKIDREVDKYEHYNEKAYNNYKKANNKYNLQDVINLSRTNHSIYYYESKVMKRFGDKAAKDIVNNSLKRHGFANDLETNLLKSKPFMLGSVSNITIDGKPYTEYTAKSNFDRIASPEKKE